MCNLLSNYHFVAVRAGFFGIKSDENRAIEAIIAGAAIDERLQCSSHLLKPLNSMLQLGDVRLS